MRLAYAPIGLVGALVSPVSGFSGPARLRRVAQLASPLAGLLSALAWHISPLTAATYWPRIQRRSDYATRSVYSGVWGAFVLFAFGVFLAKSLIIHRGEPMI